MEENIKMGDRIKWTVINSFGDKYKTGYGSFVKLGSVSGFLVEITKRTESDFTRTDLVPSEYVQKHKVARYLFVDRVERFNGRPGRRWGAKIKKEANKFSSVSNEKTGKVFPTKAFVEYISSTGSRRIESITNLKTMGIKIQGLVNSGAQKNSVKIYEVSGMKKVEFTEHVTVKVI